ncbi:hypothetical protein DMN91_008163 [Ooceraea biroi]|uniref:Uncharacterized protein n=1 Tax=Ooceraea biroi TaxID=2015173 RepID=A0A3L8DH14_OOCBI|nr:hypothetical protein DMN91_008163 [Ooceraea biroi]
MSLRKSRRDSDFVLSHVGHKEHLFKLLVIGDYGVATFQSMKKWLNDLREKVTLPDGADIPIVLLANKCDVSVAVTNEQISKFCKESRIDAWYATSAKQNTNIDAAMHYLVEKVLSARIENGIRDSIRLRHESPPKREKFGCCK